MLTKKKSSWSILNDRMTLLKLVCGRPMTTLAKGPKSFKDFAKHIARTGVIPKNPKNISKHAGTSIAIIPKGEKYQIHVKEPITFSKALEKSKIIHEDMDKKAIETKLDQISDWNEAMEVIIEAEKSTIKPSNIDSGLVNKPGIRPFYNLASIVNENVTLQRLIDLGTDLSAWEKNGHIDIALLLDFKRDVIPRIYFLLDHGIHPDNLGYIFSQNPQLFQQNIEDLKARVNYLSWRNFNKDQIRGIIDKTSSAWLNEDVLTIDAKLGFIQKLFMLKYQEVVQVTSTCPQIVLWKGTPSQLENNNIALIDSMGFTKLELAKILKKSPEVLMAHDTDIIQDIFDVLHNDVGYSHELLVSMAETMNGDLYTIKTRLAFLRRLGRDKFDPTMPNYVSPKSLVLSSDKTFCQKVAKAPLDLYNKFVLTI